MHGSNISGAVKIMKENKDIKSKNVNHTAIDVSWCKPYSKEQSLDDVMKPRDWGWASGPTACALAVKNETTPKADNPEETISLEMYLIGMDLGSNTDKILFTKRLPQPCRTF